MYAVSPCRATALECELEYSSGELRVSVRDNGGGIKPQILQTGRDPHWGLSASRVAFESPARWFDGAASGERGTFESESGLIAPGPLARWRFAWRPKGPSPDRP